MTLLMRPCHDQWGSGLEIAFDEMTEAQIIDGCFTRPGRLLDAITLLCEKQGMTQKQVFETVPHIFNVTTQHMKEKFCEYYTPGQRKGRGLPF